MIHAANRNGAGLAVEELFAGNCNDTPVTSEILSRQIALLRDEGELMIVAPDGSRKLRAKAINWGRSACLAVRAITVQPFRLVMRQSFSRIWSQQIGDFSQQEFSRVFSPCTSCLIRVLPNAIVSRP